MARKPDIQYIQFYTDGSAARQPEFRSAPKKAARPKSHRRKQTVIRIEPLALAGMAVAAVMLVLLAVGTVQLRRTQRENAQLAQYVQALQGHNELLKEEYAAGYDLEEVREAALALGMVPAGEIPRTPISVTPTQVEETTSLWEEIAAFFQGLFA